MNYKLLLVPFLVLFLQSCKQENKEKKVLTNKINTTIKKDSTLVVLPTFNTLKQSYITKKHSEIASFYAQNINIDNFNGGFLVAKNGQILFEDYKGYANYTTKEKITSSTPLHLASVSKVMTATVILKLVDQNKINLDTSLKSLFPNFRIQK